MAASYHLRSLAFVLIVCTVGVSAVSQVTITTDPSLPTINTPVTVSFAFVLGKDENLTRIGFFRGSKDIIHLDIDDIGKKPDSFDFAVDRLNGSFKWTPTGCDEFYPSLQLVAYGTSGINGTASIVNTPKPETFLDGKKDSELPAWTGHALIECKAKGGPPELLSLEVREGTNVVANDGSPTLNTASCLYEADLRFNVTQKSGVRKFECFAMYKDTAEVKSTFTLGSGAPSTFGFSSFVVVFLTSTTAVLSSTRM